MEFISDDLWVKCWIVFGKMVLCIELLFNICCDIILNVVFEVKCSMVEVLFECVDKGFEDFKEKVKVIDKLGFIVD